MSPLNGNRLWLGLVLATCVFAVDLNLPLADDAAVSQKNTCAITQVLQVMNELLTVLTSEIKDLRSQVETSCKGKKGRRPAIPDEYEEEDVDDFPDVFGDKDEKDSEISPSVDEEGEEEEEEEEEEVVEVDEEGEEDEEREEDYEYEDSDTKTPADDLIEGISKWWETIVPFARNPNDTTTTTSTTESPKPELPDYDDGDDDYDDVDDGDGEDDTDYYRPDPGYRVSTTTPEPPPSFTTPPAPTSCPEPFRLQAGGCYLIFSDQRDWRSWGDSHAFCQNYGGTLAAPWRLRELQEFLSRYYSDAFWIGASIEHRSRSWKWLSGRKVENSAWKRGQPNRNPAMKCVFLDKWSGYRANNFFCGEKYPFICDYRDE